MRLGRWSHGGPSHRGKIERQQRMVADVQIVQGGQFPDEIVRVLAIHDRFSERGPADSVPGKTVALW